MWFNRIQLNFRGRRGLGFLGCLWSVFVFVIVTACIVGVMFIIFSAMRSSDVYQQAMATLESNETAVAALGEPIKAGWFFSGSINVSTDSGNADLSIPVSGPRAKGRLVVIATKNSDGWHFSRLDLVMKADGDRIDLLPNR